MDGYSILLRGIELLHSPPFSKPGTLEGVKLCPITDTNAIELENGTIITPFHVSHTCSCLGYRLDYNSHSMSYITDTYIPDHCEYTDVVKDVNLLVHECYYQNSMQRRAASAGHSTSESGLTLAFFVLCILKQSEGKVAIHP